MGKRQERLEKTLEIIRLSNTLNSFDEYFCSMYIDHPYWESHNNGETRFKGMNIKFSKLTNGMFQIDNSQMMIAIHPELQKMTTQYLDILKCF